MEPPLRTPPLAPLIDIKPPRVSKGISKLPGRGSGEVEVLPLNATTVCDVLNKDRSSHFRSPMPGGLGPLELI